MLPIQTPETRGGQSANEIHLALKAALKKQAEAEKCAVICFAAIMARQLYRELGYASINHYAEKELGFSARRTRDFVMLTKKLAGLPLVKQKVESGELGYTSARVIVPVVDSTNEKDWVEFATTHSRRETEREVKRAKTLAVDTAKGQPSLMPVPTKRPAAVIPVQVSMAMTPSQFSRYEALWEQIRQQGALPTEKVEALLAVMQSFACGPRGPQVEVNRPPVQIHIHQCEDCGLASVQTGRGELEIGAAELEQAQCDCQVSRPGERKTTSVPPAIRREVLAKYRYKCQRPGCHHTRYLQVHHQVPRSLGGTNELSNLTCLCSACHRLLHERKLVDDGYVIPLSASLVKSPEAVYRWASATAFMPPGLAKGRALANSRPCLC